MKEIVAPGPSSMTTAVARLPNMSPGSTGPSLSSATATQTAVGVSATPTALVPPLTSAPGSESHPVASATLSHTPTLGTAPSSIATSSTPVPTANTTATPAAAVGATPVRVALPASSGTGLVQPAGSPLPMCPASLSFGQTIQCSIDAAGERDSYSFGGATGDRVLVSGETSGNLLLSLRLFRPDGTLLCSGQGECLLDATGTHTVLVEDRNRSGPGAYQLYFQRLNNPVGCTAVRYGGLQGGSIDTAAEMDCYISSTSARSA